MKFCFLPTEPGPALWASPNPSILAFPMSGSYDDPLPDVAPLTYFPLSVSLSKAVEYWWRIHAWKLTYSVGDCIGEIIVYRERIIADEESKLCFGYTVDTIEEDKARYLWAAQEDNPGGINGNRIAIRIAILPPAGIGFDVAYPFVGPCYKMNHSDVVPGMGVEIGASYSSGDSSVTVRTYHGDGPDFGSISFDGNILQCSAADDGGFQPYTFTITPHLWFSYSGTWNTATGAKN